MSFWGVVFIVLMIIWLFGVGYISWDPQKPRMLGAVLLPWICVAILGAMALGGISGGGGGISAH